MATKSVLPALAPDLTTVLRDDSLIAKADDLQVRIREIGARNLAIEDPCVDVLVDESASESMKNLARSIIAAVAEVQNEFAELLVDLMRTREVITVLDGRK